MVLRGASRGIRGRRVRRGADVDRRPRGFPAGYQDVRRPGLAHRSVVSGLGPGRRVVGLRQTRSARRRGLRDGRLLRTGRHLRRVE